jgi:hypothetical protein
MSISKEEIKAEPKPRKVWTRGRKLMGNLIPMLIALPFGVAGIWLMLINRRIFGPEFWLVVAMPVVAWLAMNFLGLYQNSAMRKEIARKLKLGPPTDDTPRWFVGFSRPTYRGFLDPHEDVGFLFLMPDRIEFRGDASEAVLRRGEVGKVRFRSNIHTFVGLGRWISIEGNLGGKPVRMLVESRESSMLFSNLRSSAKIRDRLLEWLNPT